MVLGTPLYMSPEQARGDDELDARVDIYALGVIMYEAATGRVPFIGNNYLSVISQVLNEEAQPLRELRPDLSEEFDAIVMRAMDKERSARYATANDLLADITALLDDPTRSTERAKITGPRRKAPRSKSPLKIAIWVAVVSVVIYAVVTTVVMLFGGPEVIKERRASVTPPPPPPPVVVDAAVPPPPPPDAPEAPTLEITIETVPADATIQQDGVDKGTAPVTTRLVVDNHFTEFVASAPGYEDKTFKINAVVDKKTHYKVQLKKLAKDAPPSQHSAPGRPPDRKQPEPDKQNKTGGELGGNPFKTGSAAPAPRP
jgi:serine/threonine-protein kinase